MKYSISTSHKRLLADTVTPISVYMRLRDYFPFTLLLESSDYRAVENSYSYICVNPIASMQVERSEEGGTLHNVARCTFPDGTTRQSTIADRTGFRTAIEQFIEEFTVEQLPYPFYHAGLFGYITYDAVRMMEKINISAPTEPERVLPDCRFSLYEYVIVFQHFKNELYVFHNTCDGVKSVTSLDDMMNILRNAVGISHRFKMIGAEISNFTNEEFKEAIATARKHIHRGDVFQLVLSRRFSQQFAGDDFTVYRALRTINPSPYLFYFDYGKYRLFGSSPEAQIMIRQGEASIMPIAGTFRRTGDDEADRALAEKLKADPKENAEHVMLVDLARNDLSRHCDHVRVEKFKEIQFYSHVIHLVSSVKGTLRHTSPFEVVADTFPAGTLTGAPKHRAMQLIEEYERGSRGFYGGSIGVMDFHGNFNHAIMIRSFFSQNNTLHYQAGAGLVADSIVENEAQEVHNKLLALKKALAFAETM